MPMPSQASGAVAHSFAIGKAMRRQVSSPAPPRLAEPQRNVNSHIHATNGPHTRPPPRPQPLGSHRRAAPDCQPPGEDEPTAACPDRRAQDSGPADPRSASVRRLSPPPLAAVRRSASPSGAQDHAISWPSATPSPPPTSASTSHAPRHSVPTSRHPSRTDLPSTTTDPMVAVRSWFPASSPPLISAAPAALPPGRRPTPRRRDLCPEPGITAAAANARRGRRRGPARTSKTPVAPISNVIPAATMASPNERSLLRRQPVAGLPPAGSAPASPPGCRG